MNARDVDSGQFDSQVAWQPARHNTKYTAPPCVCMRLRKQVALSDYMSSKAAFDTN
jgi:hypothetical protein